MLLSYVELRELVEAHVIEGAEVEQINQSSIDIRLGWNILIEKRAPQGERRILSLRDRDPMEMELYKMTDEGYVIEPGEFILTESFEIFHLPNNISAEFKLKSSVARVALNHMLAGWCDAGWNSSVLTLELFNAARYHSVLVRPGDWIGQVTFFKHTEVPHEHSYSQKGRYNGDSSVSGIKP
jgi:dCTP deaminase